MVKKPLTGDAARTMARGGAVGFAPSQGPAASPGPPHLLMPEFDSLPGLAAGPARGGDLSTFIDSLIPEDGVGRSYFHLHLVSDSTGETLITVGRAAAAQYEGISAIEHVYPLVRSPTAARAGHLRDRDRAGHRALHPRRPGPRRPPRGGLPRFRLAAPVRARAGPCAAAILSRRRIRPPGPAPSTC